MGEPDEPVRPDPVLRLAPEEKFRFEYLSLVTDGNHAVTQFPDLVFFRKTGIFGGNASLRGVHLVIEEHLQALGKEGMRVLLRCELLYLRRANEHGYFPGVSIHGLNIPRRE
jgi:hypothetical protein